MNCSLKTILAVCSRLRQAPFPGLSCQKTFPNDLFFRRLALFRHDACYALCDFSLDFHSGTTLYMNHTAVSRSQITFREIQIMKTATKKAAKKPAKKAAKKKK